MSKKWKYALVILALISCVAIALAKNHDDNHSMDAYLTIGNTYYKGCHDKATFELVDHTVKALCNDEVYYEEQVENPGDYAALLDVKTDFEKDSVEVVLLPMYIGHNSFKLVQVVTVDNNRLDEGDCRIIVDNDYSKCKAATFVLDKLSKPIPLHDYKIGDVVAGTDDAQQTIGFISGTVIAIDIELVKVQFDGKEEWINVFWLKPKN